MLIPCVICGLGIDSPPGGATFICEYEPGVDMRNHLVERHAKYVARALLNPNQEDKVHFWLLTNVNSSTETNEVGDEHTGGYCTNGSSLFAGVEEEEDEEDKPEEQGADMSGAGALVTIFTERRHMRACNNL